jgi:putative hemolysin
VANLAGRIAATVAVIGGASAGSSCSHPCGQIHWRHAEDQERRASKGRTRGALRCRWQHARYETSVAMLWVCFGVRVPLFTRCAMRVSLTTCHLCVVVICACTYQSVARPPAHPPTHFTNPLALGLAHSPHCCSPPPPHWRRTTRANAMRRDCVQQGFRSAHSEEPSCCGRHH